MNGWQPSRVLTAAELTGRSLLVRLMSLRRGDSTLLDLRVAPKQTFGSEAYRWQYGSRSSYPPIPPSWPLEIVDPWEQASYSGPLLESSDLNSEQPCGSCGTARAAKAKYCGDCGARFDPAEAAFAQQVARIVGDAAVGSPTTGADLAALIETYTQLSGRLQEGRAELLQFIEEDFARPAATSFIRGEPTTVTPDLTLAIAQDIHQAVAATGQVRFDQIHHAELLLRYAPMSFGYWGPFKALVKSVPADEMPDAYADAIARLSSFDTRCSAPPSVRIEDIRFLGGFSEAPSQETVTFLARRARRDLAALADRAPDSYARIAARMIRGWDGNLSRKAFAPAFVMLGARKTLDAHGKHVVRQPDMRVRRDAHPDIWNNRPALVQEVFDSIENSVEAHTWSFQVLESLGQAPPIMSDHLDLGLLSTYPPLSQAAIAALSTRPGMWDSLTVAHWSAILRHEDDANVDGILDALSFGTSRPVAVQAARLFLAARHTATPRRLLLISLILLSANQSTVKTLPVNDIDPYLVAIATVFSQAATKYKKLWLPIVKELDVKQLRRLRAVLPDDAARSALQTVADELTRKLAEQANPSEAFKWIASADPLEANLGWQILDKGNGLAGLLIELPQWISKRIPDASTVHRVVAELLGRVTPDDVPQLGKIVQKALDIGLDSAELAALLTKTPTGRAVTWRLLARAANGSLVDSTPDAVRAVGDDITIEQLGSAAAGQSRFIARYIAGNPARIARDFAFGVACATSRERTLQAEGIKQLQMNGQMPQLWLLLAESGVPKAFAAAREYLAGLSDGREFRDAVLQCMDSKVAAVRDLGTRLLNQRLQHSDDDSLWTALAESDDPRIERLIAAEAGIADRVDERVLAGFDRRVLVVSRHNRRAKESAKARLQAMRVDSGLATPERIATLLELARGVTLKDKEWALEQLADLALSGVTIDGLDVSLTTIGGNS